MSSILTIPSYYDANYSKKGLIGLYTSRNANAPVTNHHGIVRHRKPIPSHHSILLDMRGLYRLGRATEPGGKIINPFKNTSEPVLDDNIAWKEGPCTP